MSKEILEKSLEATEKREKLGRRWETAGYLTGIVVAFLLDALAVWAIFNFLIGVTISYQAALGGLVLVWAFVQKLKD